MLILGGHLGNMLISHSCYIKLFTIPNAFLCQKTPFQILESLESAIQEPIYCKLLKFGGHFGLCKLGTFPYWDFLGLLVWCSGDLIETHSGKKIMLQFVPSETLLCLDY